MVDWIGEVFDGSVKAWQERVAAAQQGMEGAQGEEKEAEVKLEAAKQHVQDIQDQVKGCKDALKASKEAEKGAQQSFLAALDVVTNWDKEQKAKAKELENATPICTTFLEAVKSGDWASPKEQKQCSGKVIALLRTLEVDKSLFGALPTAFQKRPAERGPFDEKVVAECEDVLKDHMATLTERVNNGQALKAEKEEATKAAQESLNAATKMKEQGVQDVQSAEEELKDAMKGEREVKKVVEKMGVAVGKARDAYSVEEQGLQRALAAQESLHFLAERTSSTGKEPAPSTPKAEAAASDVS